MPSIRIKEESFEGSLRRFKRMCEKAGVYAEMRRHEFYEKKTWKRKRQKAAAKKRLLKRLARERIPTRGRTEKPKDTRRDGRGGRTDFRNRDNQTTS